VPDLFGTGGLRPDYGVPLIRIEAGDGPSTLLASRQWSAGLLEACTHRSVLDDVFQKAPPVIYWTPNA
jgi:hypothetical protein